MSVPRRLRFEILRRDGYRCRYCGVTSGDTALVVDHVLPESLGGATEAANLVTACAPCNSGKGSVAPDQPVVEEVAHDAERWTRAVELVARWRSEHYGLIANGIARVDDAWDSWGVGSGKSRRTIPRPSDWDISIQRFLELGLSADALVHFVSVAMNARQVHPTETWVYFCGCCWAEVRLVQRHAAGIVEDEERGL